MADGFYVSSSSVGAPGRVMVYPEAPATMAESMWDWNAEVTYRPEARIAGETDAATAANDSFYRAKLRESFAGMSAYRPPAKRLQQRPVPQEHQQQRPVDLPAVRGSQDAIGGPARHEQRAATGHVERVPPLAYGNGGRDYGYDSSTLSSKESSDSCGSVTGVTSRVYRSASDLQLDREAGAYSAARGDGLAMLHKEYVSADPLEATTAGASGGGDDSFFAMLRSYQTGHIDQRAAPPPDIHRVLRGRTESTSGPGPPAIAAASSAASLEDVAAPRGENRSPSGGSWRAAKKVVASRTKSAGELTTGLLRRFKGGRNAEAAGDSSSRSSENSCAGDADGALINTEEKARRKAFVHFDCQSVGISFMELARHRESRRNVNTTTGASAASRCSGAQEGGSESASGDEPTDAGDGRGNALLDSCPYFRNELGGEEQREVALTRVTGGSLGSGRASPGRFLDVASEMPRPPACNGISLLDLSASDGESGQQESLIRHNSYVLEYTDRGALYYRRFFRGYDHQNYFGVDENLGPVAVSFRRDRGADGKGPGLYRIIIRTSELSVMRGAIAEDAVPSSSRHSSRGVSAKDVIEYVCPDLQISCLRLAVSEDKTKDQLLKLDEQGVNNAFKIGVLYCKAGQLSEEEMYNNQHAGSQFEEFLDMLGRRVRLLAFTKYRGGLDNIDDTAGTHSVYATCCNEGIGGGRAPVEVMFHVSTMLPYSHNNRQQLLRKRHIGNDIVTIVFQEPGAPPFSPKMVRSHFQHVFVVVRAHVTPPSSGSEVAVRYSVAVSRSKDVPPFGPPVPAGATFHKSADFADFLLAKVINAENATHRSEKFVAMAVRTRKEYLKDLAANYATSTLLDSISMFGRIAASVGSVKKKEKKPKLAVDLDTTCAVVWNVQLCDCTLSTLVDAYLAISADTVAIIEMDSRDVIFTTPCSSVIGWTSSSTRLCVYYNHGECVTVKVQDYDSDDIVEMVGRLARVTRGCETLEMVLRRNGEGQLGFHVHYEGVVSDVEPQGAAWRAGLVSGSRLVEICKVVTATRTHDQVIDLLRTSETVIVLVIPPALRNGEPRDSSSSPQPNAAPSVALKYIPADTSNSAPAAPAQLAAAAAAEAGFLGSIAHARSDSRDSNGSQRRLQAIDNGGRQASPAPTSSLASSSSFYTEYSAELQRNKMRVYSNGTATPLSSSSHNHVRAGSSDMSVASAEDLLSKTLPESLLRQHLRGGGPSRGASSSVGAVSGMACEPRAAAPRRRAAREMPTYPERAAIVQQGDTSSGQLVAGGGSSDCSDSDPQPTAASKEATSLVQSSPRAAAPSPSDRSVATKSTESVLLPSGGRLSVLTGRADPSVASAVPSVRHSAIITLATGGRGSTQQRLFGEGARQMSPSALVRSPSYENLLAEPYLDSTATTAVREGYRSFDDVLWKPQPTPRFEATLPPSDPSLDMNWSNLVDAATKAMDARPAVGVDASSAALARGHSPGKNKADHFLPTTDAANPTVALARQQQLYNSGSQHNRSLAAEEQPGQCSSDRQLEQRSEYEHIASLEHIMRLLRLDNERLRTENERLLADNSRLLTDNSRLLSRVQGDGTAALAFAAGTAMPPAPAARTARFS